MEYQRKHAFTIAAAFCRDIMIMNSICSLLCDASTTLDQTSRTNKSTRIMFQVSRSESRSATSHLWKLKALCHRRLKSDIFIQCYDDAACLFMAHLHHDNRLLMDEQR